MRLIVRPKAEADLLQAFGWYEDQRPGLGREFMEEVSRCQRVIELRPMSFALVDDLARRAIVHRFPYAPFFVLGADILIAVAEEEYSAASRAFAGLGITRQQLLAAANSEIASNATGPKRDDA